MLPQTTERHPRVGVWADDPIMASGLVAVLPAIGFEPLASFPPGGADVLLVSARSASSDDVPALVRTAELEGVPVVWMRPSEALPPERTEVWIRIPDGSPAPDAVQACRALLAALRSTSSVADDPADRAGEPSPPGTAIGSGRLSAIELEVLRSLADGQDTTEIAAALFYSERTVKNAVSRAMRTLGAVNRSNAVALALRRGYL